jgi:hypothetical protein
MINLPNSVNEQFHFKPGDDIYNWQSLPILKTEHGYCKKGKYFIELVTKTSNNSIDIDAWVRLIDDKGNIYSVGLERSLFVNARKARLIAPVPNDLVQTGTLNTKFIITEEQFNKLIKQIEDDKKNDASEYNESIALVFAKHQSIDYVSKLFEKIGINLDNKEVAMTEIARKVFKFFGTDLPSWFQKIVEIAHKILSKIGKLLDDLIKPLKSCLSIAAVVYQPLSLFTQIEDLKPLSENLKQEDYDIPGFDKTQGGQKFIEGLRKEIHEKYRALSKNERNAAKINFKIKFNLPFNLSSYIKYGTLSQVKDTESFVNETPLLIEKRKVRDLKQRLIKYRHIINNLNKCYEKRIKKAPSFIIKAGVRKNGISKIM